MLFWLYYSFNINKKLFIFKIIIFSGIFITFYFLLLIKTIISFNKFLIFLFNKFMLKVFFKRILIIIIIIFIFIFIFNIIDLIFKNFNFILI